AREAVNYQSIYPCQQHSAFCLHGSPSSQPSAPPRRGVDGSDPTDSTDRTDRMVSWHLTAPVQPPASSLQPPAFSLQPSAFSLQPSAFSLPDHREHFLDAGKFLAWFSGRLT